MIPFKVLEEKLKEKNLTSDEREKLVLLYKPFYEFNDYMREKFQLTNDEIEKMSEKYSQDKMSDYKDYLMEIMTNKDDLVSPIQQTLLLTAKIYGNFAKENGYDKYEELQNSLAVYLEIMLFEQMNKMMPK